MKRLYVLRAFLFVCLSAAVYAGVPVSAQDTAVCNEGASASGSLVTNEQGATDLPATAVAAADAQPVSVITTIYKKVTSAAEIVDGGVYLIINDSLKEALSTINISTTRGLAVNVAQYLSSGVYHGEVNKEGFPYEVVFEKQSNSAKYALRNSQGYISVIGDKTDLTISENLSANALWTVTVEKTYVALKGAQGTYRYLAHDDNAGGDFRYYSTGLYSTMYKNVQLYKKTPVSPSTLALRAMAGDGTYYATFSDMDNDVIFADGVKVYTVTVNDSRMSFRELDKTEYAEDADLTSESRTAEGYYVPKGNGVLIGSDGDRASYYLPAEEVADAAIDAGNMLEAAAVDGMFAAEDGYKYYKLAYDSYTAQADLGFYYGADDGGAFTVRRGIAYLAVPDAAQATSSEAAPAHFVFGGEDHTTAIRDIGSAALTALPVIYNLAGQRMTEAGRRGIYIVNGRKVIMK